MLTDKAKEAKKEYYRNYRKNMSPEAKEKEKEYNREWRRKNPDKVKSYNESHWEKRAMKNWNRFGDDGGFDALSSDTSNLKMQVIILRNKGYTFREIGEELNISHMKANRIIKKIKD